MSPIKAKKPYLILIVIICVCFHLYFLFLAKANLEDLIYFDILLVLGIGAYLVYDWLKMWRQVQKKRKLLSSSQLITPLFDTYLDDEILTHDLTVLHRKIDECYRLDREKEDEMAKWIHEIKIPLAALGLLSEKIDDHQLRTEIKEQQERIGQSLASLLVSMRLTSPILDVQIKPVLLFECVKASLKNNQFFLIRHQFEIHLDNLDQRIYTDKQWLTYVFDQLIANAIKYAQDEKYLAFVGGQDERSIYLEVIDHGEGIALEDLGHIFEKGYTGMNKHNGKYKSTGMGLYFASKILKQLGHSIEVKSETGKMTCFTLRFFDNRDYFNL